MPKPLNVLILEDNPADAELLLVELRRASFKPTWQVVDNEKDFTAHLKPELDVILSDYVLPQFTGLQALQLLNESGYDIPFIIVSGMIGEELALECMRVGAVDYVFKDNPLRLGMVLENAIKEKGLRDEKTQTEEALRESEERFKLIYEHAPDAYFLTNMNGTFINCNKAAEKITGYKREELIGSGFLKTKLLSADQLPKADKLLLQNKAGCSTGPDELILTRKDGTKVIVEERTHPSLIQGKQVILGITRDITDRKCAEKALVESENKFRWLYEYAPIAYHILTPYGIIMDINRRWCQVMNYSREEVLGKEIFDFVVEEERKAARASFMNKKAVKQTFVEGSERNYLTKAGAVKTFKNYDFIVVDQSQNITSVQTTLVDITERKRSEQLITALNQAAINMSTAISPEVIFTSVAKELKKLNFSCFLFPIDHSNNKLLTKYLSFESKVINVAEKLTDMKHEDFSFPIDSVDVYRKIILEKKAIFDNDAIEIIRQVLPKSLQKITASIAKIIPFQYIIAPLNVEDNVTGLFSVLSNDLTAEDVPTITAFSNQLAAACKKAELLQSLSESLKERNQAQQEIKANLIKVQKSLDGTINAMTSMVEKRDPYTAGHQTQVTKLAIVLAIELHLPADQIMAIKVSGLVHDIGKINVPSEILSKPGKLTQNEFRLLKSHPKHGFDILKTIDFPWPVAEIVYQHHERIDGTGYPRHLKGDKICIEAKILAVADVVEAMSSHRPYRPALGIEEALKEITQNRGTLFDKEVVNACLKVFKAGYEFPKN